MTIRLAAQESTLPGDTLMEKFQATLDCGFDGIELSGQGGGVFAADYTVRGPLADPKVSVNPLSALTPGFLRGVFNLF